MNAHRHSRTSTGTLVGVESVPVDVEVDVSSGLPSFTIVGLPDVAVQEARERVRSALKSCGYEVPNARIVVNLAPGPLRKHGTGFDLPIALALLAATGQFDATLVADLYSVGELSLDGAIRPTSGILAHAAAATRSGKVLVAPAVAHGTLVSGEQRCLTHLSHLRNGLGSTTGEPEVIKRPRVHHPDFSEVRGHGMALRALAVAAAGGHNVLLVGSPGTGKTLLASCLPTILPELTDLERQESALIHSVAGLDEQGVLAGDRPFRAPHHTATIAGLVGGGSPPRPGEVSLAHNGVLFLDEMSEFGPATLQALRQPMEEGVVTLVRAQGKIVFPSRFSLVGAANPCPCGFLGDSAKECTCPAHRVEQYRSRIGGPLMDRIDIVCTVGRPDPRALLAVRGECDSAALSRIVERAREFAATDGRSPSAGLRGAALLEACRLGNSVSTVERMARGSRLSGRGITRLLRVARTLADIDESDSVADAHLEEALLYRSECLR